MELAKYNLDEATISAAPAMTQWAFFFLRADRYEASRLRELLPGEAFQRAITVLETIAAKTEDRQMYDQREKALRDHQWLMEGAREQGFEQGQQVGHEKGREVGRQEGCEEGLARGALIGKIQILQQLLCDDPSSDADLRQQSLDELNSRLTDLQQRLCGRDKL